jgi:hypothetical protein
MAAQLVGEPFQLAVVNAERGEMLLRIEYIVDICASSAARAGHKLKKPAPIKTSGVLGVAPIRDIGHRRGARAGAKIQFDAALGIDRRNQFAIAQIRQGRRPLRSGDAKRDAVA